MSGPRILIVEDEPQLRRALRRSLEGHGYEVQEGEDAAEAMRVFTAFKPDVVLLDLMLPDSDGIAVCAEMLRLRPTPIIVLSVLGDEKTKVRALDEGADDYLTKPFATNELMARVRVALRRSGAAGAPEGLIEIGDLSIDHVRRRVLLAGEEVHLTPTEYNLLRFLAANAGKVLTHPMILRNVWGEEYEGDSHVLRTYVNQLRAKLHDDPLRPRFIRTDPGVGYRFTEPETIS